MRKGVNMANKPADHDPRQGMSIWQVLSSLGDSIAVVDRNYRLVWLREPMMDRNRPQVGVIGKHCYALFGDGEAPCRELCPVTPVYEDGRPHMRERHFIDPQGVERWREARAFPIVDEDGQVAYVARISFDITHLRQKKAAHQNRQSPLENSLADFSRLQLSQMPFQPSVESALTHRELEVLRLMAQGYKNPRIGQDLGISVNTVKRHVVNIFNKLDVNGRTQAAVWAAHNGLV